MSWDRDHAAIRELVSDYLEGMIWGDETRLRRAFHPGALQIGHFGPSYEFFALQEFIDWIKGERTETPGTPYVAEILSVEVTGTVAIVKLSDSCFGTDFIDYLIMVKDRPHADGKWQIVTKTYHVLSGTGLPPGP
ncbi:MAG: nuclear transport factor 2 family protein [Rhodospirillaceae bacterium]|nr:nuclear transport factor 2 family protein [Rhodospirillaceae bacterium]